MYHRLKNDRMVYCDVDDTLILWEPENYIHKEEEIVWITDGPRTFPFLPHKRHIEFLQKLKLQGYGIVVYSAAGGSWAENVIKHLKLEELPDLIMSKPEFVIDDFLDASKIIKSIVWINPNDGKFLRNE